MLLIPNDFYINFLALSPLNLWGGGVCVHARMSISKSLFQECDIVNVRIPHLGGH